LNRILISSLSSRFTKVIEWIKTEGENALTKYSALSLECGITICDEEQEFEKYYFISMVSVCYVFFAPAPLRLYLLRRFAEHILNFDSFPSQNASFAFHSIFPLSHSCKYVPSIIPNGTAFLSFSLSLPLALSLSLLRNNCKYKQICRSTSRREKI
jgi:hypothetical protein